MKIAIVVHGRFFAFALAQALSQQKHEVKVFTNYPKWATRRFGVQSSSVQSNWLHGLFARCCGMITRLIPGSDFSAIVHRAFGAWAAWKLIRERWDAVYVFSGVAEELLQRCRPWAKVIVVIRASAHILTQDRLLAEEATRTGVMLERPTKWLISRELREYALADSVIVLSNFAQHSFLENGFAAARLRTVNLGFTPRLGRCTPETCEARCGRIRKGDALRILFVGAFSYRKGIVDFAEIVRACDPNRFRFRFVGHVEPFAHKIQSDLRNRVNFVQRQAQHRLTHHYAWGDIFLFPTIEDGFAEVLLQALGAGLPVLTTTNCAGPDIIREGETGWILPIRSPEAFLARLRWCDEHRDELADLILRNYQSYSPRSWEDAARDFVRLVEEHYAKVNEPATA
jgi:glycosyltransferase involved in cell wall biosynthesis